MQEIAPEILDALSTRDEHGRINGDAEAQLRKRLEQRASVDAQDLAAVGGGRPFMDKLTHVSLGYP